jgi:hypothetical protein
MKRLVSMRAALDDELLGKALPGLSWASWRILLIAIMGEPLLDEERPIVAELTGGREREPCELVEEFHAVVGRNPGDPVEHGVTPNWIVRPRESRCGNSMRLLR